MKPSHQETTQVEKMTDNATSTRRRFMSALGSAASLVGLSAGRAQAAEVNAPAHVPQWGMAIDLDRCTGCQACVVACRAENNIPVGGPTATEKGRSIFWMNLLVTTEGEYPDVRRQFLPTPCNHCEDPPCIKVCPVGATTQNEEGITQQIPGRCIGCRMCAAACPYTRRYFNWSEAEWPESLREQLNPDIAVREHGVMEKCLYCHHRIRDARFKARAEGRALADADVRKLPACASSCPADAITFGDMNDPKSEVRRLSESPRAYRLLPEMGTRPKTFYLREVKWQE